MIQQFIQTLKPYAREPYSENPPELLPWASDARWSIDDAARRTLGLLLSNEQPGPRLYAYADYLLAFISPADRLSGSYPDGLLLNGAALALAGYLAEDSHPEAEIGRLSGSARLATIAQERRAALEDKVVADSVLAVCQVAEALNAPLLADLISLRERMWGRLLDHSRAERIQVSEMEYPLNLQAPIAPEKLGARLRARPWQITMRDPQYLMEPDLQEAEETCRNLITIRAHMLVKHQFGSEIDWHLRLFNDIESTVGINGVRWIRNLAYAYAHTSDEKFAQKAARLLWSWYTSNPVPNHKEILGPWRTLEVGSRQWRTWVDVLGYLGQTAPFDDALHAMMARSRLDHLRYAAAFTSWPNNWYQVEAAGMAVSALYSPELKQSDAYLRLAMRRLKWINSFAYYNDGFQFELSHGYHMFPTDALFAVVQAATARGVQLPAEFVTLTEKAHEMYLYAVQPNHLLPTFNDNGSVPIDPAPTLRLAAEVFDRADFLWSATHGKAGLAPDHTSHAWPAAKLYAMRDRWGEDGQFLFFDGGAWGASHQHEDKLSFTLYSHGRLLIGDPNIYSYSPTELTHYFKSSRAHNLIMIDGKGQARRFDPTTFLTTQGRSEWVTRPQFDFVSSEYLEGYAPDPFPDRGSAAEVDRRFSHRRAIFYVKPGYWLLCDLVNGPDDTEMHQLEQLFHLAPLYHPGEALPLVAGEVFVSPEQVVSHNAGASNIALLPVDSAGIQARAQKGETSPAVGWYGMLGEFPAWDVTLERTTSLPARMDVILWALAPGSDALPEVKRIRQDAQVTAFSIQADGIDDVFILCEEDAGPVKVGDITYYGRALLLRRKPTLQALAVSPVELTVNGKKLAVEG